MFNIIKYLHFYDVVCPHCGHEQDIDLGDYPVEHNEVFDYDCENCARSFEVLAECTWQFEVQTEEKDGE